MTDARLSSLFVVVVVAELRRGNAGAGTGAGRDGARRRARSPLHRPLRRAARLTANRWTRRAVIIVNFACMVLEIQELIFLYVRDYM